MQHYQLALATHTAALSADDLASDIFFLRHFLLLVYDICLSTSLESIGNMWLGHLRHLQRIALLRREQNHNEPLAYVLWTICQLCVDACLLGAGTCEFFHTMMSSNLLPPVELQLPPPTEQQVNLTTEEAPYTAILALSTYPIRDPS